LQATSREEFFGAVKKADPKNFVLMHEKLEYFADKHYTKPVEEYTPSHTDFRSVPQQMKDWVVQQLPLRDRPKTLVVWGPSRTGKTSWARSHGNHSYLAGMWMLKAVDEECDYIVIDDMEITNFRNWLPFLGEQSTNISQHLTDLKQGHKIPLLSQTSTTGKRRLTSGVNLAFG
jgi:hypothetical protein